MNAGELAGRLKTPGILLLCYFIVPPLIGFALGALFADLAQAGLGIAVLQKLRLQKGYFSTGLEAWLGQFRQPAEKTSELTGSIISAAGWAAAAALLLPPVGHLLPRWLAVPLNLAAIGFVLYTAYGVWQLYAPFTETLPEAPEPEPEPEAPRAPEARCPRCGQKLEPADEFCVFCRRPVDRPGPPPGALGH